MNIIEGSECKTILRNNRNEEQIRFDVWRKRGNGIEKEV